MNWLDALMSQTSELESPRRYFYFAGLSVLSAVAGRKMWLDRGGAYKLYPNIYVMLVGPSGIKKGLPIRVAEKLVSELKVTKVISGRSSVQAIIEHLGMSTMNTDGSLQKTASAFIVSGEFSQSILDDQQAFTILTDLYDSQWKDEYTNLLKAGKSILKEVYLTMLSASNQVHLHSVIGQRDIQGGFIARTLFVNEEQRNKKNALVRQQAKIDYEMLTDHLKVINSLTGEFHYTDKAADFYEKWYDIYEPDVDDNTGTNNRLPDTVLKVAMLISLSRGFDMLITIEDLEQAIEVCMACAQSTREITENAPSQATNEQSKHGLLVMQVLLKSPEFRMSRTDLIHKLWRRMNSHDVSRVIDTMLEAKAITEKRVDGQLTYFVADAFLKDYLKNVKQQTH